jgi:hypothetical protein
MKFRKQRWARNWLRRGRHGILVWKPLGKCPIGRLKLNGRLRLFLWSCVVRMEVDGTN